MLTDRLAEGERRPLLASRPPRRPGRLEGEGEEQQQQLDDEALSFQTRITALLLLFLLSTGANWTEACLGPLKKTLQVELDISNAQYGVISASTQLANTVLPIFAGLWIDRIGASRMSIVATMTVFLGAVLAAFAVNMLNFHLLVLGRVIQGIGVIIVDTAATKLIVRWSNDVGWIGVAISCNFALDRAAAALSKATSVPISQFSLSFAKESSHHHQPQASNTFLFASVISIVSLIASLSYIRFEKKHADHYARGKSASPTQQDRGNQRIETQSTTSTTAIFQKSMKTIPPFFVLIAVTQFYQPIAVFNNLSADILRWRGSSEMASGYLSSVGQVMPIFVAPLLGRFFDRCGHRLEFVPLTALLLGTSIALLAWSHINSLFIMILFSLANALNTPPYLTSLAILLLLTEKQRDTNDDNAHLLDQSTFGCSWGIWKSLMQSNQIIMNTTLGHLQDVTPGKGYESVLMVLFVSKIVEFICGLSYIAFDHTYANRLLASPSDDEETKGKASKHQQSVEQATNNTRRSEVIERSSSTSPSISTAKPYALQPNRLSTCILYFYLITIIVTSWILFFVYYFR